MPTLKQFVTERRVVFSVAPEFNEKTKKAFLAMEVDVRSGKNLFEVYTNVDDLKTALLE